MTNRNTTKRALISAVLVLVMCMTSLIGTTFAWFTDSVSSEGNIIQSGNLKIGFYWANGAEDVPTTDNGWTKVNGAIFNETNWEPGYVSARHLKVKNEGSLAFQYRLVISPIGEYTKLAEVIDVYFVENATKLTNRADLTNDSYVGTLADLIADPDGAAYGTLLADNSKEITVAFKMNEDAGNEYQGLSLGDAFTITVFATQMAYESDNLGDDYDGAAEYPMNAGGSAPVNTDTTKNGGRTEFDLMGKNNNVGAGSDNKVGSASVPYNSVEDDDKDVEINVIQTETNPNVTVTSDQNATSYNITASNIKADNNEDITVVLYIGEGKSGVSLYHYDEKIPCTYNAITGNVTFQTKTFSPFTVVYDAVPVEVKVPESTDGKPVAIVTPEPEFVNTDLEWGSYGQWSPTEGLDNQLEAAYKFQCAETAEQAAENAYANWYCDFYVMLDKDLGENQIFLGGNYGSFGWIGFHNREFTLEANTEVGLLESVTSNPWTYADVATWVGTFICGVGDVNNQLSGATFTVMLRLTNPQDSSDYFNVSTIEYKFQ